MLLEWCMRAFQHTVNKFFLRNFLFAKTNNYLHYLQYSYYTTDITITLLSGQYLHCLHYNTCIEYGIILKLLTIQNITSFIDRIIFSSVSTYLKFYPDEQSHMQIFQYYN